MSGSLNLTSLRGLNCPADELATVVEPTLALVALIWFEFPVVCGIPFVGGGVLVDADPVAPGGVYRSFIPLTAVWDSGTLAQSNPPSVVSASGPAALPSSSPKSSPTRFGFLVDEYRQFGFCPSSPTGMP